MNGDFARVVEACTQGSDGGMMTFPQVLTALQKVGVERYHADLLRSEKTYYTAAGASHVTPCNAHAGDPPAALSAGEVEAAIRASQQGRITYDEFCGRVIAAGCVGYFVTLIGRRAVYYGRSGETFVEPFPT